MSTKAGPDFARGLAGCFWIGVATAVVWAVAVIAVFVAPLPQGARKWGIVVLTAPGVLVASPFVLVGAIDAVAKLVRRERSRPTDERIYGVSEVLALVVTAAYVYFLLRWL